jgi:hypothetical protein
LKRREGKGVIGEREGSERRWKCKWDSWTRVSNLGLAINAKVRREVANLLYLFILFTKIKKKICNIQLQTQESK